MPYTYNPFTRKLDYYEPGTASSGESNVGVNLGSGEVIYAGKVGVGLQFKSLDVGSSSLTISSTADTITLDVDATNLDHTDLQNIGTNTHAQIDTALSTSASHIADADKHREINDSGTAVTDLWSADKIATEISEQIYSTRVVFKEQFTGDTSQTQFQLTNAILNGTFTAGAWAAGNILNTLPSNVTNTNKKALYNSANIFTRNRISVSSISAGGLVTLSHAPRAENFYIWYWYDLQDADIIDDYYREDFLAEMESVNTLIASSINVDVTNFNKILGAGDSDLQTALETIDDHTHTQLHDPVTLAASATTGGLSLSTQEIGFQAASTSTNGYLTSTDWNTFNNKSDAITTDTTYYVDGDTGSDSNDGSSWANAKQTFAFLHPDSADAIPREIAASVTINGRGSIPATGTSYHTVAKGFYGSGSLTITGSLTLDESLTIDTYNNSLATVGGRFKFGDSGKSWTTNEHQGKMLKITGVSVSGREYFPILSNDGTTILSPIGESLTGTPAAEIYTHDAILLAEDKASPGTPVNYGTNLLRVENCSIPVYINYLDTITSAANGSNRLSVHNTSSETIVTGCTVKMLDYSRAYDGRFQNSALIHKVAWEYSTVLAGSSLTAVNWGIVNATGGATDQGLYTQNATINSGALAIDGGQVDGFANGIQCLDPGSSISSPTYAKHCTLAIDVPADLVAWGNYQFEDCGTCISLSAQFQTLFQNAVQTGCTTDIRLGTNTTASFADYNAGNTIANAATGAAVVYLASTFFTDPQDEYNNASSGLSAYTYQDAIDELDTAVDLNTTHRTSDGSDHAFLNQSVTTTASPTFEALNSIDYIDFDTTATPGHQTGRLHWSSDNNTLEVGMTGSTVVLQIGQEGLVYVRNNTVSQIDNGKLVYASGAIGDNLTIDLADNTDIDKSIILGMATENIGPGADGYVALWGKVRGLALPTATYTAGDKLYLNTSGDFTLTHPTDPTHAVVIIGTVTRAHNTEGEINIRPLSYTIGNEFDGTMRQSIINKSTGTASAAGFTVVNDLGHRATFGLGGSNNTGFPGITVFYGEGYNDNWYAVDGNKSHKFYVDPTDSHDNSSLSYLSFEIQPDGDIVVPRGQIVSQIITGTSPLNITSTTLNTNLNADLLDGQHGSYYLNTSSTLDDLADVDTSGATQDQVIAYNASSGTWTPASVGASVTELSDLTDVDTSGATADQVLVYDPSSGQWLPQNQSSGFSDPMTTRGDLIYRDSSNTTTRLGRGTVGQVLTSDGTDISWEDATAATTFIGLSDTPGSYTTANAIYTTNGTPNAVIETTVVLTEAANTFNITKGTASLDIAAGAALDVNNNLTVSGVSEIDQDVTSGSSPTFDGANFTGIPASALPDADDDGATKGVSTYDNSDFNVTAGVVTIEDSGVDHNSLTNTHNLTTDIDHDQLTNFASNEHFTEASIDHANIIAGTGADHSYIDQSVISGSSPTFDGANITGVDAANVDIADAGAIITATDVEGALQENRTAIDLNTADRHVAVTLAASATTGGLGLSTQEISFQAATTGQNGYLTSTDWNTFDGKLDDPMTTRGDIIYRNASNTTTRLAAGSTANQVLQSDGTDISWQSLEAGDVNLDSIGIYGFENQTDTTISFNDSTYVFTLTDAGSGWSYWRNGVKVTISGNKTVTLPGTPPTAAAYFIYIDDESGTLTASTSAWTLVDTKVPVAILEWNDSNTPKYFLANERHQSIMQRRVHYYEHFCEGTQLKSGGLLAGYSVAPSSPADTDNTFSISQVELLDEDLLTTSALLADPNGTDLDYIVYYRVGASTWSWEQSEVPFRYTAAGYIQYDNSGTMTQGSNGDYYNWYLCFTNYQNQPRFICIPGQSEFASAAGAYLESVSDLDLSGFDPQELVFAYQLTFYASNPYSNKGKCRLTRAPHFIGQSVVSTSISAGATDHNALGGLQGGNGTDEYYHLTATTYSYIDQDVTTTGTPSFSSVTVGNTGLIVGTSTPFSDAAGTLTLQNIDVLDATTESTIEAAIDTLANLTSIQGHTVTLTGDFIRSGAHSLTLTTTGITDVTLPTSGTLATTAQIPTVSDIAYDATSWNGNTDAATKNAIRDKIETMDTAIGLNTTHRTSDGSDHTFIDQDVTSGSSPTFTGTNFTSIPAAALPDADDDGATKGVSTYDNSDFNVTAGLVTIEDSGVDHNSLTNTHNLTTDIDHDQLTNFAANEHFTEASIDHANIIAGTGADHSYIDQSVVSGATPTFTGTNFTGIPVAGLANGTAGQLITWGAGGVAETVATGTSTHVLTSNGTGAAPTFQAISLAMDDLSDVNTSGVSQDEVLAYNASSGTWTPATISAVDELSDLSDVDTSGATQGQVLTYNISTGQWTPDTASGSGDVSSSANITDNTLVRGDGGAKGVQDTGITADDSDRVAGVETLTYKAEYDIGNSGASATMTLANGRFQKITLTSDSVALTISTTNLPATAEDGNWILFVHQDVTAGRAITSASISGGSVYTSGGSALSFTDSNGAIDIVVVIKRGANIYLQNSASDLQVWT